MDTKNEELFPHDEYYIYTTSSGITKTHVHLTEDIIKEARRLHNYSYREDIQNDWKVRHKLKVADNVWLTVGDTRSHEDSPELITYGYEGEDPCEDGNFEDRVFFEGMIFYECTKRKDSEFGPEWDVDSVREWVRPDHRELFDSELKSYLSDSDRVLPRQDGIDQ